MASSEAKQVVDEMVRALSERRLEGPRFMAIEVIDHNEIVLGRADEPGAALDECRQQLDAFGQLSREVVDLVEKDGVVVAGLWVSGRHIGVHPQVAESNEARFLGRADVDALG